MTREHFYCTYGSTVRVYPSSSAEGPHLWLAVEQGPQLQRDAQKGQGHAHLNEHQVLRLMLMLATWLKEQKEDDDTDSEGVATAP